MPLTNAMLTLAIDSDLDAPSMTNFARVRGDGGFTAQIGQHGTIWLDYDFE